MPSSMAKPKNQKKPTKQIHHQSQKLESQKLEKPPSWAVVRGLLTCKHSHTQKPEEPKQQQQQLKQQQQQQPHQGQKQKQKQKLKQKQEQAMEEAAKKSKKMKCSGSLCNNTKVMHRPETGSPERHKKRATMGSTLTNNEGSNRSSSMKGPLNELNGIVSTSSSSLSMSSNSSVGGSFRGMPFRRFSGCYECRMVVDPVLGFTRDPSLRGSICSCPDCGEIFMKAENLELHQAVRHAGKQIRLSIFNL